MFSVRQKRKTSEIAVSEIFWKLQIELEFQGSLSITVKGDEPFVTYKWNFEIDGKSYAVEECCDLEMLSLISGGFESFTISLARKWKKSVRQTEIEALG